MDDRDRGQCGLGMGVKMDGERDGDPLVEGFLGTGDGDNKICGGETSIDCAGGWAPAGSRKE